MFALTFCRARSQGIFLVVNLQLGVWYQKCYDPECRAVDYKSPNRDIPLEHYPFAKDSGGVGLEGGSGESSTAWDVDTHLDDLLAGACVCVCVCACVRAWA